MTCKKDLLRTQRRLRRTRYAVQKALKASKENRLRLSVFRSAQHIYGQVIDDTKGHTCAAASSLEKEFRTSKVKSKDLAASVGKALGARAVAKGIKSVISDRGSRRYHGRIAAFFDGVREAGIDV